MSKPFATLDMTTTVVMYNGVILPTPKPIPTTVGGEGTSNAEARLPPVWLVTRSQAVLATRGTFFVHQDLGGGNMVVTHADAFRPGENRDLATMSLAADESVTVVVGSNSVGGFKARIGDWASNKMNLDYSFIEMGRPLNGDREDNGTLTTFKLEAIHSVRDQLLAARIIYNGSESAIYLWRLNPAMAISEQTARETALRTAQNGELHLSGALETPRNIRTGLLTREEARERFGDSGSVVEDSPPGALFWVVTMEGTWTTVGGPLLPEGATPQARPIFHHFILILNTTTGEPILVRAEP